MERERKYRYWNGDQMIGSEDYDLWVFFEQMHDNDCEEYLEDYTGLQDKNGKDIYEGDILGVPHRYWDHRKNEIIYLKNEYITVKWERSKNHHSDRNGQSTDFLSGFKIEEDLDQIEIIGNIHMNPEELTIKQT